jgi:hypothetical protein
MNSGPKHGGTQRIGRARQLHQSADTHQIDQPCPLARAQRRPAAIMTVDVVDYSRLMGRDESGKHKLRPSRCYHMLSVAVSRKLPRSYPLSLAPSCPADCPQCSASAVRSLSRFSIGGQLCVSVVPLLLSFGDPQTPNTPPRFPFNGSSRCRPLTEEPTASLPATGRAVASADQYPTWFAMRDDLSG